MDQEGREISQEIQCDNLISVSHNHVKNEINPNADSNSVQEGDGCGTDQSPELMSRDAVLNLSVSKTNYITKVAEEERNTACDYQDGDHCEKSVSDSTLSVGKEMGSTNAYAQKVEHVNDSGWDCPNGLPGREQLLKYNNTIENPSSSPDCESASKIPNISNACSSLITRDESPMSSAVTVNESIQRNSLICNDINSDTMNSMSIPATPYELYEKTSQPQIPQSILSMSDAMDVSESINVSDHHHISSCSPLNADADGHHVLPTSSTSSMDTVSASTSPTFSTPVTSESLLCRDDSEKEVKPAFASLSQPNIKIENQEDDDTDGESDGSDAEAESAASSTKFKSQDDSLKILTKYVYINKSPKPKPSKKKLGLLYKQAFRHFHRSKVSPLSPLGKFLTKMGKESSVKKEVLNMAPKTIKKSRKETASIKTVSVRTKPKTNRGRKKGTATSTSTSVKKTQTKSTLTVALKEKSPRRKSQRRKAVQTSPSSVQDNGRKRSGRKRAKIKRRKYLTFPEKVEVLRQLESPSASSESITENFNIDTKLLEKIKTEKDKIMAKLKIKEEKAKKREKRQVKTRQAVKLPEIKEEKPDEDEDENEAAAQPDNSADEGSEYSPDHVLSARPLKSSKGTNTRTRNELTLQQKVFVIYELEKPDSKVRQIAKKYGVSSSAVSRVRRQKDRILFQSLSGDVCHEMKRTRECKDPILDRALLKWYRAVEALDNNPISITNTLLVDKARDIAIAMGKTYFPSINWIIRWKYRHNIVARSGRIESKEALDDLDVKVDLAVIITAAEGQMISPELQAENGIKAEKSEKMIICEHCGIMTSKRKDKRRNNHLKTCPLAIQIQRRDLTLGEKAQVARALEKPGMKMVTLAKKYGVSSSAISRIHKNRVDILARCAGNYVNVGRKRDRGSKEPEVERLLCEWYHMQQEYGYHVSGTMIREKARDIAAKMGKDFWPSDSWVFRWRNRNNVNAISGFEEIDDDEVEEVTEKKLNEEETADVNDKEVPENEAEVEDNDGQEKGKKKKRKRKKESESEEGDPEEKRPRIKLPRSVMCEKCGCVSARLKNNRIRNMRHAKGCPDLKPRHELTYEERVRMLKALEEPGATLSSVARQFGISASSMSRMNQKRESIMTFGMDYAGQKRIRDCKEPEVAKLLYAWFLEKQREGIHVTGTKLKEKAGSLAQEMGREFKASTGWLGRWKHRYNVIFRKDETKSRKEVPKKRSQRKKSVSLPLKPEEVPEPQDEEDQQDSASAQSVITILPDQSQPFQAPRMFLNQRYQTPWAINYQTTPTSCARSKEFISPPNHGVPEENHVPYTYDAMPRHMFQNVFENFSTSTGYPVGMVDPGVPVRDYLQQEENETHHPSTSHHHILPHQPPPLNLHTPGLVQPPHPIQHPQQPPIHHPSQSPGTPSQEVDNVQQQQIMEACKLMNSFAKEKSLGEHVQAALRTIEMTLKSNDRKGSQRTTYTNI